jgi:hypothetical protein
MEGAIKMPLDVLTLGASKKYTDTKFSQSGNMPSGGTTGQILAKNSNTDFDTKWENLPISSGTVRYDAAQTLTDEQKTQARENIGAGDTEFIKQINVARNSGDDIELIGNIVEIPDYVDSYTLTANNYAGTQAPYLFSFDEDLPINSSISLGMSGGFGMVDQECAVWSADGSKRYSTINMTSGTVWITWSGTLIETIPSGTQLKLSGSTGTTTISYDNQSKTITSGDLGNKGLMTKATSDSYERVANKTTVIDGTYLTNNKYTTASAVTSYVGDLNRFVTDEEAYQQFATVYDLGKQDGGNILLNDMFKASINALTTPFTERVFNYGANVNIGELAIGDISPYVPDNTNMTGLSTGDYYMSFGFIVPLFDSKADLSDLNYWKANDMTVFDNNIGVSASTTKSSYDASKFSNTGSATTIQKGHIIDSGILDSYADSGNIVSGYYPKLSSTPIVATDSGKTESPYTFSFAQDIPANTVLKITLDTPVTASSGQTIRFRGFSDGVYYTQNSKINRNATTGYALVTTLIPAGTELRLYNGTVSNDTNTKIVETADIDIVETQSGVINPAATNALYTNAGLVGWLRVSAYRFMSTHPDDVVEISVYNSSGTKLVDVCKFTAGDTADNLVTSISSYISGYDLKTALNGGNPIKYKAIITRQTLLNMVDRTLTTEMSDSLGTIDDINTKLINIEYLFEHGTIVTTETAFNAGTVTVINAHVDLGEGMVVLIKDSSGNATKIVQMSNEVEYGTAPTANDYKVLWPQTTDFTTIAGYDAAAAQTLQHDASGNLSWVNNN